MKRVVLLVEDDAVDAESFLRAFGADDELEIVWKQSAEEAWAWLESRGSIEVVAVVDINLPGMSGFELVEHWRRREAAVVWYLSSSHDQAEIERAYSGCAAGYFVKESSGAAMSQLVATLRGFVRGVRLPQPTLST